MVESVLQSHEKTKSYRSDLTDFQWEVAREFLRRTSSRGAPTRVNLRAVLDAIFYLVRNNCGWRDLPHDFPPRSTVNYYFRKWQKNHNWERLLDALNQDHRETVGRDPTPSAACVDSQSVKTTESGGPQGYDGGKKVKGRKRHIVVDTLGLLLAVFITTANVSDAAGAVLVLGELSRTRYPRLCVVFADSAYDRCLLKEYLHDCRWFKLEVSKNPKGTKGFVVIRKRWVVEQTFGWLNRYRRLSKDYERTIASSEAMVRVAMIHVMLRRLKHNYHNVPGEAAIPKAA